MACIESTAFLMCPHCYGEMRVDIDEIAEAVLDMSRAARLVSRHSKGECSECGFTRWTTETELIFDNN